MKQSLKELMRGSVLTPTFTSVVLAICLLIGHGFRTSDFPSESVGRGLENFIASSAPVDSTFTSAERQVRVQNKAPRRQMSFGVVPRNPMLGVQAVSGRRPFIEACCPSSASPTRPNDRAPPLLTA